MTKVMLRHPEGLFLQKYARSRSLARFVFFFFNGPCTVKFRGSGGVF